MSVLKMTEGWNLFAADHEEMEGGKPHSGWSYKFVDFVTMCLVRDVKGRALVEELLKIVLSL